MHGCMSGLHNRQLMRTKNRSHKKYGGHSKTREHILSFPFIHPIRPPTYYFHLDLPFLQRKQYCSKRSRSGPSRHPTFRNKNKRSLKSMITTSAATMANGTPPAHSQQLTEDMLSLAEVKTAIDSSQKRARKTRTPHPPFVQAKRELTFILYYTLPVSRPSPQHLKESS